MKTLQGIAPQLALALSLVAAPGTAYAQAPVVAPPDEGDTDDADEDGDAEDGEADGEENEAPPEDARLPELDELDDPDAPDAPDEPDAPPPPAETAPPDEVPADADLDQDADFEDMSLDEDAELEAPSDPRGPGGRFDGVLLDADSDWEALDYDPARDSPEARQAAATRNGGIAMGVSGLLLVSGALAMGLSDPKNLKFGNSQFTDARNQAALVMGIPGGVLLLGGVAMIAVGVTQQKRLRADVNLSSAGAGLTLRGRF